MDEELELRKRLDGFLKELSELSNKYGLVIWGCGCCGSPNIEHRDSCTGNYQISSTDFKSVLYVGQELFYKEAE